MSRCLTCKHWKPSVDLMAEYGVRSGGFLTDDRQAVILAESERIRASWLKGPDGQHTPDQIKFALERVTSSMDSGVCQLSSPDTRGDTVMKHPDAWFYATAPHEDEAYLKTHELFGCIQFEDAAPEDLRRPQ